MTTTTIRRRRGFTLVELLIAMVIMGLLIMILAFSAGSTSTAMGVRGGWLTLGQAQLAGRSSAQNNPPDYYFPAWVAGTGCVSDNPTSAAPDPTSTGLTFLYNCASTSTSVVSISSPSSTTVYYTLLANATTCLVVVDHLSGVNGSATTYGEDAAVASGQCNASNVGGVAALITSTSTVTPTSLNGTL